MCRARRLVRARFWSEFMPQASGRGMPGYEPGVAHYHSLFRSRSARTSRALSRRLARVIAPFPRATKCLGSLIPASPAPTRNTRSRSLGCWRTSPVVDFIEFAAVPVVAVTARQMLFRDAPMRAGDRVLVQGAAGNVGAYAVRFARAAGAQVIASVLPTDRDEALRLGADEVISIPSEEAERLRGTFDAVIDTVGGEAQRALFAYVRKGGALISSVSAPDARLAQQCGIEAKFILVDVNTEDLRAVADFLDAQQFVVRIGQVLPLAEARRAHEMLEGLRPLPAGKIVLNAVGDP